ncbi:MAG: hypothetical protein WCR21_04580, partial [Bacteroidota bacterium]
MPSRSGIGFVRSSEFVTKDDMTAQKIRPNNSSRLLSINGKIDFAPTPNTNISFGAFYEHSDDHRGGSGANQIFNSVNNSVNSTNSQRYNLAITQKFGNSNSDKNKSQSLLSNSFFKFLVSYENIKTTNQSALHKDKFFDYGYVGKFDRTFREKDWAYNYDFVEKYDLNGQAIN